MKKRRTSSTTSTKRKNSVTPAMSQARKQAAAKLARKAHGHSSKLPKRSQPAPTHPNEAKRLVHEVQLHKVELKTQNEKLRRAQLEVEEVNRKYRDLYESVPVACYTLDARGTILDLNQAGATLLQSVPHHLVGRRFPLFLFESDRTLFMSFIRKTLKGSGKELCAVRLATDEAMALALVGSRERLNGRNTTVVRLAVMDVTGFLRVQGALQQANEALEATVQDRTRQLRSAMAEQQRHFAEQQQSENMLREGEERFRALVKASSDVVYRMSPDWTEMRHLVGRDFIADTLDPSETWLQKYIHPDDQKHVMDIINKAVRTKSVFELEHRVLRVDGTLGWVLSRAIPVFNATGEILEWCGMASDVTLRKQAEESLRETQMLLQDTEKIGRVGGWEVDINTRELRWTEGVYAIHEVSREFEPTVDNALSFYTPESRPTIERVVQRTIEVGKPFDVELELITAKGNLRWVHAIGKKDLNRPRVHGFLQDITARKQAEEALRLRESEIRTLVENSQDFIVRLDRQGRQIYANPATARLYGLPLQDFLGKNLREMGFPEDVWRPAEETCNQVVATGQAVTLEQVYPFGGTPRYFEARHVPEFAPDGSVVTVLVVTREITERKWGEEQLRAGEELLRAVMNSLTSHIAVLDAQGAIIAVNEAWSHFALANNLQISSAEWVGVNYFDVCRKAERQDATVRDILQGLEDVLAGVRPFFDLEYPCHSRTEQRWFHLCVTPMSGSRGRLVVSHENITDQRRAQEFLQNANIALEERVKERTAALAEANERWEWVVRATHDGVWDWDLAHDTVYFSPRWKEMHGFQESELIETMADWSSRLHPEDRGRVLKALEVYLASEKAEYRDEYRIQRKDGRYIWVLDRGVAIWDDQGRAVRMVGAETDITWRKESEELLRRRVHEFQTLADNVPALFSYIDRERRYRFVNKQYEELFGRSSEEIVGMPVSDLLGSDGYAIVEKYLNRVLGGEAVSFEYALTIPGEGVKHLSAQYVPDRNELGQTIGFFALVADVTALKQSEAVLREREAELRALSIRLLQVQEEERRRIARDLHDDVTQRLAALTLELHGMMHYAVESGWDPSVVSKVKGLGGSVEQLTTDVQQLAHHLHPSILEHVGLEAAVREQVDEFSTRMGLTAEVMTRDVPHPIPLDHATCLYRVLQESLQNVRKHAKATNVLVRLLGTNRGIGLCVHDDGQGFEAKLPNGNRKGLGLTSMAERVWSLKGTFRVRTRPDDGTEVHAWVPLEDVKGEK